MDRRNALKLFGTLFVCLAGVSSQAGDKTPVEIGKKIDESATATDKLKFTDKPELLPMNYSFTEEGMGSIIIERKNGKRIEVPFSDICDALETT